MKKQRILTDGFITHECDGHEDVPWGIFGGGIEVTGELKSNGSRVQRTGTSNGNGSLPLGMQIEIASEAASRSCAAEMLGVAASRSAG